MSTMEIGKVFPWPTAVDLEIQRKPVDIIIPIFNSPQQLCWCIESLYRMTNLDLFHLFLVDDGSDQFTHSVIEGIVAEYANITLLQNQRNEGYLAVANRGLRESHADRVILLNSDVILTPHWLERLLAAADSDPAIGLVCPLSNRAENLSLAMPAGFSFLDTASTILSVPPKYPDAATVVGFCLLLTRQLIEAIGHFDPLFSPGYVEEADYQFRARTAGFRAVVADDVYVYHARNASFGKLTPYLQTNYPLFTERWETVYREALAQFNASDPLKNVRTALQLSNSLPPDLLYDVVFYLPVAMAGIGGMISVVELTNQMILQGLRVTVAHPGSWNIEVECLFTPLSYRTENAFLAAPPRTKVLVATGYQTVQPVLQLCQAYGIQPAYFIQDYEGYFDNAYALSIVTPTYEKIPTRITVSQWLADLLLTQHGLDSTVIPPGVAINVFYPRGDNAPSIIREAQRYGKTTVFAVLREEERRGAPYLLELARRMEQSYPAIQFFFAGAVKPPERSNTTAVGLLDHSQLALYLSTCDIVLDSSLFHGFGMLAIEAMASGTAVILTDSGGCHEYANSGVNSLLTPPRDVKAMEDAVLRLHQDPVLRAQLGKAARKTAEGFDWSILAAQHAAILVPLGDSANLDQNRYGQLMCERSTASTLPSENLANEMPFACAKRKLTVYQLFNDYDHLYSVDPNELFLGQYRLDGPAFTVWAEPDEPTIPLYRFRHLEKGNHFLGVEKVEGNAARFIDEGVIGYILPTPVESTVPLYRARHPRTGDYTCSLDVASGLAQGYIVESIIGYVPAHITPSVEERLQWLEAGQISFNNTGANFLGHRFSKLARRFYRRLPIPKR